MVLATGFRDMRDSTDVRDSADDRRLEPLGQVVLLQDLDEELFLIVATVTATVDRLTALELEEPRRGLTGGRTLQFALLGFRTGTVIEILPLRARGELRQVSTASHSLLTAVIHGSRPEAGTTSPV